MAIQPINLPQAAGIGYGQGDVKHFAPGDAMDVPGLQNPTRHLAERDNLLAEKLNEVVENVNNQEQFVPLPLLRTILAPLEEAIITNYRIPEGFESRVLNASIASMPQSADIELNIYYSASFGASTGASVVSTASEYSGGVRFYGEGEFVVAIKNKTGQTLEIVASALLTLRPVGAEGGLLVASIVKGDKGDPGQQGQPGLKGDPGTGGAGSPGMIWTGAWVNGHDYAVKEVVSFDLYGSLPSSFICELAHHSATSTNDPTTSYGGGLGFWSPVSIGVEGPAGTPGAPGIPGTGGSDNPVYGNHVVNGTITPLDDYVGSAEVGYDGAVYAFPNVYDTVPMLETYHETDDGHGLAILASVLRLSFVGSLVFKLPLSAYGAKVNYSTTTVQAVVAAHGTVTPSDMYVPMFTSIPRSATELGINVLNANPCQLQITIVGFQPY